MKKTLFLLLLAVAATGPGCGSKNADPAPTQDWFGNQPAIVSITPQPGASYMLAKAKVTYAEYDAMSMLDINGLLKDGRTLALKFGNQQGGVTPYETTYLSATCNGAPTTNTAGHTIYTANTKKVSGSFQCTLDDGTQLTGSFTDMPLIIK